MWECDLSIYQPKCRLNCQLLLWALNIKTPSKRKTDIPNNYVKSKSGFGTWSSLKKVPSFSGMSPELVTCVFPHATTGLPHEGGRLLRCANSSEQDYQFTWIVIPNGTIWSLKSVEPHNLFKCTFSVALIWKNMKHSWTHGLCLPLFLRHQSQWYGRNTRERHGKTKFKSF